MAEDKYNPEEPIRFTDKRKYRPDDAEKLAEGEATAEDREAAATDPAADPLAEAERILADVPDEAIEVQQAHEEPAGEEGDGADPAGGEPPLGSGQAETAPDFAPEDPEVAEEPELREVPLDQAAGGVETEPQSRIEAAEEELAQQGGAGPGGGETPLASRPAGAGLHA